MYAWSCLKCLNRWETSHTVPLGSAVSMWNRSGRQQTAGVTSVMRQRTARGGDRGSFASGGETGASCGDRGSFPAAISASCMASCAYACMAAMLEPIWPDCRKELGDELEIRAILASPPGKKKNSKYSHKRNGWYGPCFRFALAFHIRVVLKIICGSYTSSRGFFETS